MVIADSSAAVAEEERRRLTRRIQAGIDRAQREGKWLGAVPKGFRRDDSFLQVIREADRNAGEISYLGMRTAIERVDEGKSYRSVAAATHNLNRVILRDIDKDDDCRA